MNKMKQKDRYRSLLEFTFRCAVRRSLKPVTGFLSGAPGLIILVPPDGRMPSDYVTPVVDELCGEDYDWRRGDCGSMVIKADETREVILSGFESECWLKVRAVVIAETAACIPEEIRAAADAVLEIDPLVPSDLVAACKTVLDVEATEAQAADALSFPEPLLLATLRHGRTMEEVLRRLRSAPPPVVPQKPKSGAPVKKLEAMHGYGIARQWGLQLARDLADWKAGLITWDDIDRGMLLSGPPGVGKTIFAKTLAAQCDIPLIASSLSRWQSRGHLGDLLKAMRADFAKARENVPCIVFVDELDSFGDRKTFNREHANYSIQVVNGLLECLDGIDGREGVIVIGATNNPAKIDAALLRSGRFDHHVAIALPDSASRIAIMREELELEFQPDEIDILETLTAGFSGADLAKVCRDARRGARKQRRSVVANDLLENLPSLVKIEGEYRRRAAIHEAGHALVGWRLGSGRFLGAMIADHVNPGTPTPQIGAALFEYRRLAHRTRQTHLDRIAALLAGMAAEELVFGEYADGAGGCDGSDLEVATTLSTLMEAQHGLGDRLRYSAVAEPSEWEALRRADAELAARIERTLREQFARAKELIERERLLLEHLAGKLFDGGKVSPEQLEQLAAVAANEPKIIRGRAPVLRGA